MKSFWKYFFISLFSLIILGYIGFSIWYFSGRNREKVCGQVVVVVEKSNEYCLISDKEVLEILAAKGLNPIGKTIKNISTDSIEDAVSRNPMVRSAECYKLPSGRVDIIIRQRKPMFRVVGLGSYYIDDNRKPMPVSPDYAAYVPVVSGHVTVSMAAGQLYDFMIFLKNNSFWNAQIEQVFVREDKKIELVPRVGDAVVLLGSLDDYEKKLAKLYKLYKNGFNIIGWNKYKLIDLRFKNQVVCNKREDVISIPKVVVDSLKKDSIIARKL